MSARQARRVIGRLQTLSGRLLNPVDFYASHLADYRELAAKTAFQVLINLRPADADPELWQQQALGMSLMVGTAVSPDQRGMVIWLSDRNEKPRFHPDTFSFNGVSIAEIERFVDAGRHKENQDEPGKNLDARDDGKSNAQIAWRIMYAMRLGKPGTPGLEAAIQKFLSAESRSEAEKLLPQVLTMWIEVFSVRAVADFRQWVHASVASLA